MDDIKNAKTLNPPSPQALSDRPDLATVERDAPRRRGLRGLLTDEQLRYALHPPQDPLETPQAIAKEPTA